MEINEAVIARINELYHKSKDSGLTPEEAIEQAELRKEYVSAMRRNLRGTLNQVSILNPDGSVTELKNKDKNSDKGINNDKN